MSNINDLFFALPLIVAVSLVYSATRHEDSGEILVGAGRMGVWICGFMSVIFCVLWFASSRL